MTLREFMEAPRIRTALVALAVGALAVAYTLVHAIRPPTLEAAATAPSPPVTALQLPPAPNPVNGDEVAANDIFSPSRKPGRSRYKLPGEKGSDEEAQIRIVRQPVVLGTVLAPNPKGSFAAVQMSGSGLQPKSLHIGENIEGYVVLSIVNSSVRFLTPAGDTLEVFRNR